MVTRVTSSGRQCVAGDLRRLLIQQATNTSVILSAARLYRAESKDLLFLVSVGTIPVKCLRLESCQQPQIVISPAKY